MYLLANEIPEEKQVPVFLSTVGRRRFSLPRDLFAPDQPKSKTLDQLASVLKKAIRTQATSYSRAFLLSPALPGSH